MSAYENLENNGTEEMIELVDTLFEGWDGGFAGWVYDMRRETLEDLRAQNWTDLPFEIVYLAEQVANSNAEHTAITKEIAQAWLEVRASELADAIEQEMIDMGEIEEAV